jgi:hypothetical protein
MHWFRRSVCQAGGAQPSTCLPPPPSQSYSIQYVPLSSALHQAANIPTCAINAQVVFQAALTEVVSAVCVPGWCGTTQHLLPALSLLETAATA